MVNKQKRVKIPPAAGRILDAAPFRADLILDDKSRPVLVEYKTRIGMSEAWQLARYAEMYPNARVLAVAEASTSPAREILAQYDVAVVDALGNARINLPGLHVHRDVAGVPETRRPARLSGRASVIAQAMLLEPQRHWQVHELAEAASSSPALAHRVLSRLESLGVIASSGSGPNKSRSLTDPGRVLSLLTEENRDRAVERERSFVLAPSYSQLLKKVTSGLLRAGIDYAVSGSAGAQMFSPSVTAVPVIDLWVSSRTKIDRCLSAIDAQRVTDGNNLVVRQERDDFPLVFRQERLDAFVANPVRLFVELWSDPKRGRAQAEMLRRAALSF